MSHATTGYDPEPCETVTARHRAESTSPPHAGQVGRTPQDPAPILRQEP